MLFLVLIAFIVLLLFLLLTINGLGINNNIIKEVLLIYKDIVNIRTLVGKGDIRVKGILYKFTKRDP